MSSKSIFFAFIFVIITSFNSFSQDLNWKKVDEKQLQLKEKMPRGNTPTIYQLFDVNLPNLTSRLLQAPKDNSTEVSNTFVKFPDANGNISLYEIYNSPMMETELANESPNIHNFTGINQKDKTNVIKISITPAFGMHIMGFNGNGTTYYIDTYTTDFNTYILYKRNDIENSNPNFQCLVSGNESSVNDEISASDFQVLSIDNKFRTYRLAMACTLEYARFHVAQAPSNIPKNTEAQKKDIVLSAMNVTVNRLNGIYERDLAIRLVLVANNRNIIFIDSDNFTNDDEEYLIDESQEQITRIIGSANFDIGHTVSTGGGGLASPAPCDNGSKASGITGSARPVGDPFDIDYVAHEVGHQFGANHTFNGTTGSCGGRNRNLPTAVEPGSGTTIMAYAGICGENINVQRNSDTYFHATSIKEITDFLNSRFNNCPAVINKTTNRPTITSSGNKTIPHSTPFILTANGAGNNSSNYTYTWEQTNTNQSSTQPPVANATEGPNYRSLSPTTDPSRSFPSVGTVLAGTTNSNGIVSSTWERTPTVARSMKFTGTVRDNNAINGGQTASTDVFITFANAGPFVITYPSNISNSELFAWSYGSQRTITWNVAGTTANGINTSNVNILLSVDNGQTYPYTLASNALNNGTRSITVPNLPNETTEARIKIEAVGNIFYTVSKSFYINATASNKNFEFDNFALYPNPTSDVISISFNSTTANKIEMELFDIRGRKLETIQVENNGFINQEINLSNYKSGVYLLKIKDGSNQSTKKIIKK